MRASTSGCSRRSSGCRPHPTSARWRIGCVPHRRSIRRRRRRDSVGDATPPDARGGSAGGAAQPMPASAPPPGESGVARRRVRAVAVALIGAVIIAGLAWAFRPTSRAPERSIAVLPFANMGPATEKYFSEGLTEEIITRLSAVPTLKVISRTSAMRYEGSTKSLRKIAEELGVAHVLEGSIRRDGGRVRITAQLIDAAADHHLWSRSYDREVGNVLGVQDEIARDVGEALEVELAGAKGALATRGDARPGSVRAVPARALLLGQAFEGRPRAGGRSTTRRPSSAIRPTRSRTPGSRMSISPATSSVSPPHQRRRSTPD